MIDTLAPDASSKQTLVMHSRPLIMDIQIDRTTVIPDSRIWFSDPVAIMELQLATTPQQVMKYVLTPVGVITANWLCRDVWHIVAQYCCSFHGLSRQKNWHELWKLQSMFNAPCFWTVTPSGIILLASILLRRTIRCGYCIWTYCFDSLLTNVLNQVMEGGGAVGFTLDEPGQSLLIVQNMIVRLPLPYHLFVRKHVW